jgi:hypothetical protein
VVLDLQPGPGPGPGLVGAIEALGHHILEAPRSAGLDHRRAVPDVGGGAVPGGPSQAQTLQEGSFRCREGHGGVAVEERRSKICYEELGFGRRLDVDPLSR